ncbi:hypothetical protein CAP35_02090 [Chitinophagaceae bacterium IBVUCB1]|nr:hypothetical protein CAP35_02090 [Chitinophagaceae bacterium IBVUCB1]
MTLFTEQQYQKLLENGKPENRDKDHPPIIHLHLPYTKCEWLISELDPENPNIAFGLCDLGMGFPELGSVDLEELQSIKVGPFGFSVLSNPFFVGTYPMSIYAEAAKLEGQITRDEMSLNKAFQSIIQRKRNKPKP